MTHTTQLNMLTGIYHNISFFVSLSIIVVGALGITVETYLFFMGCLNIVVNDEE
jgi:hypothetical protein